jgi:alpha-beta hydrolase superfamily lysophospholipase
MSNGRRGQSRFFTDQSYHFQTLRALNDVAAHGADVSEVLETIRHVRAGDAQGWFAGWEATGDRVRAWADTIADPVSRGRGYLRAHNYYRTAEFFLPPNDAKRPVSFAKSLRTFYQGLDLLGVSYKKIVVPYGAHRLNAVYYPGSPGAEARPLIVFCGGFDSTLEELYLALVAEAHNRGYAVLTFEGPGQGAVLREQGLPFVAQWENPTSAVLDGFLASHSRPPKIVLIGMSMGGYLAPRAAAFDDRIDGVVAWDVLFDMGETARRVVPQAVWWLHKNGFRRTVDLLTRLKAALVPGFAWALSNGMWTMGTNSPMETVEKLQEYTLAGVAHRIRGDVLILAGAEDHLVPVSQVAAFQKALTNARSVTVRIYHRESGGAEHCQLGAPTLWHAAFFDWMHDKFG